jgi:hypothetical protein
LIELNAPNGPLAWRLPEEAYNTSIFLDCCVMQIFESDFGLWVLEPIADRPARRSAAIEIPSVTA